MPIKFVDLEIFKSIYFSANIKNLAKIYNFALFYGY